MKLVTVLGARPQFVKAYPLSLEIRASGRFEEVMVHTGQHFDPAMSDIFFAELGIAKPSYFLDVHGGNHGEMTGRMLEAVEKVLMAESPAAVIVYGDTNSTLAGALAAAKLGIPVAHIEAGLRSFNRAMPEEINRVIVDHLSAQLLCPTSRAIDNLRREGITENVHLVGDLTYDATLLAAPLAEQQPSILKQLGVGREAFGIATVHRAENLDDPANLKAIAAFLRSEACLRPLIMPLHPRTRMALSANSIALENSSIRVVDPLGYLAMTQLLAGAEIVITDSGGLQREAYFYRVPCVTLRSETEWVETVEYGWNRLWTIPEYLPRHPIPGFGTEPCASKIVQKLSAWLCP